MIKLITVIAIAIFVVVDTQCQDIPEHPKKHRTGSAEEWTPVDSWEPAYNYARHKKTVHLILENIKMPKNGNEFQVKLFDGDKVITITNSIHNGKEIGKETITMKFSLSILLSEMNKAPFKNAYIKIFDKNSKSVECGDISVAMIE